ncbi:MAG: hypothetical protein GX102_07230 [Porphyromonadaceae bacterium]|jgi:hypothetical protein|nr:hypothetical protein [Porphyromonadaceae bacterium]
MKKLLFKSALAVVVSLTALLFAGCGTYYASSGSTTYYDYGYNNPTWAPAYYSGVRYYYFPDIETYFDLATREFIVLNMGQWLFAPSIIAFYPSYDLFNSYVVVLNTRVYQPWMHHQYYVRHYPRYYYINYYDYSNIPYVRGFNENKKSAIFYSESERYRARPWDDSNIRSNRKFNYSSADRRVQQETTRRVNEDRRANLERTRTATTRTQTATPSRQTTTDTRTSTPTRQTTTPRTTTTTPTRSTTTTTAPTRSTNTQSSTPTTRTQTQQQTTTTRRSTETNYYGRPIGNPVRVEPQMRQSEPASRTSAPTRSSSDSRRSEPSRTPSGNSGNRR